MSLASIMSWILCGVIVGMAARVLAPDRDHTGLGSTTMLGVGGALIGGLFYSVVRGIVAGPLAPGSYDWCGWIVASVGAGALVVAYPYINPKKRWS